MCSILINNLSRVQPYTQWIMGYLIQCIIIIIINVSTSPHKLFICGVNMEKLIDQCSIGVFYKSLLVSWAAQIYVVGVVHCCHIVVHCLAVPPACSHYDPAGLLVVVPLSVAGLRWVHVFVKNCDFLWSAVLTLFGLHTGGVSQL